VPVVVALNKFFSDTDEELRKITSLCRQEGVAVAVSEVYSRGGKGGLELARKVAKTFRKKKTDFKFLYPLDRPLIEKIETIAKNIYGAAGVAMEGKIKRKILRMEREGFAHLPVCIAKTQYSLSDDEELLGRPEGFTLIVTDASLSSGAGFVVVYCGDVMTMPGLPKSPAAEKIDVSEKGEIIGLI